MQINVSQLLKEAIGSSRTYEISEAITAGEGESRPVKGTVNLVRTDRGILVTGELHTEVELTCSRCLGRYVTPLTVQFEEEYIPTIDVNSGLPLPAPEEPTLFTIDEHHIIDLDEAVRQYALLAMPMKPLCREDCAGICAECGQNLNEGPCGCPERNMDPRWAALSKLLKT
jgi:uncharacterized protein